MTESRRCRLELEQKTKVAMASMCEQANTANLSRQHNVHASQVASWKRVGLAEVDVAFLQRWRGRVEQSVVPLLLSKIGQQQVRIDELESKPP